MDQRTCTHPGCGKPHRARGLCGSHYNQAFQPNRHAKRVVECSVCGKPCEKYASGTRRPVCGYRCRYAITYGKDVAEGREMVGPVSRRPIPELPELEPVQVRVRFVSGCCQWCAEPFTFDLRVGGVPARFCRPRCASNYHRHKRRLVSGQFTIKRSIRLAIYARDAWTCQLCQMPVDKSLDPTDAWAATLDHIECQAWVLIPDHSPSNLRLAHRMCNSIRADESR